MLQLALICGGPSIERGISLNSARSVLDHLPPSLVNIHTIYVDQECHFYQISTSQLYSNTPSDFDFKLEDTATFLDKEDLISLLKQMDMVFPVIHGRFGDDGELQQLLEEHHIPYVGSSPTSCKKMFFKHLAQERLNQHNFFTLPFITIAAGESNALKTISLFFTENNINKAVVKPVASGSSIGVYVVTTPEEALAKAWDIFIKNIDHRVIVEPFCKGIEFTVVVFQNDKGTPVALLPTEVELPNHEEEILDYRKKYLPSTQVFYHTPARFDRHVIQEIRGKAQQVFQLFNMRDFVRMDGWVLEGKTIYISDINPISGLEQNSYLFRQSTLLGMTHASTLLYILKRACQRYNIPLLDVQSHFLEQKRTSVFVLFGGSNAERQVSLMSGTNVWLKLLSSKQYAPVAFFLDKNDVVWELPYATALNHSVEDVHTHLQRSISDAQDISLIKQVQQELDISQTTPSMPSSFTLERFLDHAKERQAFIFIALHGDKGENGHLQSLLEEKDLLFNGSSAFGSSLCMDKAATSEMIIKANYPDLLSLPKYVVYTSDISSCAISSLWDTIVKQLGTSSLIIKPVKDGCSAGIVCINNAKQFERYFEFLQGNHLFIPANTFDRQEQIVELSVHANDSFLLEPYIQVDTIYIEGHELYHKVIDGWIELTAGVMESSGTYHSFSPSIAISSGAVLSLEEKFQGGTGVNITPPPLSILTDEDVSKIKRLIEQTAKILHIHNYARIDIFYNHISKQMIIIEANSLPGLTPSTVIYHQALCESPSLYPKEFLEKIITLKQTVKMLATTQY
ncbi:MAG: hypothetical protein HY860_00500 [Chlamydiales bacterium]|nr:hypothetical protein [Chlamydiales bacterium]